MKNVVEILKNAPDYIGSDGRSEEVVHQSEIDCKTEFADDYKDYLREIGLASFDGHELTGITHSDRLDVVSVTEKQHELNRIIPADWYVIEEAGIDGIVIWQNRKGEIFLASAGKPEKIADSLADYITNQISC